MAEIKLRQITVQMLLRAMLVGAEHSALENAEIAFDGVGGDDRGFDNRLAIGALFVGRFVPVANVLVLLMVDGVVTRQFRAGLHVDLGLICHQVSLFGNVGADDWRDLVGGRTRNMEAADLAGVAIKQRKNRVFVSRASASLLNALQAANVRLVNFYRAAVAAHRRNEPASAHGLTQAMHQEPSRFVADAEHAVHLMGADALLGGRHEEQRGKPLGQRDFGALENGPDRDGELLAAGRFVALIHAATVRFAVKLGDLILIGVPAMRANPTVRPNASFKPVAGLGFVD